MCRSKRITNDHSFVQTSRAMLAGCLLLVVGLGISAASGAAEPLQGNALAAVSTYRTMVAHELTNFSHQRYDEYYDPKISGDGSRIVYYTFDRPNGHEYLYLANFDGSNTQLLKDKVNGARSYYGIQISNNGGRIVMYENYVVWVFQPGGPAPFSYIPFGQTTVLDSFIMNGNGGQIYFVISNDRTLQPIGLFVPRGVYRMNYDGTGSAAHHFPGESGECQRGGHSQIRLAEYRPFREPGWVAPGAERFGGTWAHQRLVVRLRWPAPPAAPQGPLLGDLGQLGWLDVGSERRGQQSKHLRDELGRAGSPGCAGREQL